MKMRNRSRRNGRKGSSDNWLDRLARPTQRKRKSWTFEQLESRHMFSATPLGSPSEALTMDQVFMGEMYWAFKQASNLSQYSADQLQNTTQWAIWTVDPDSGNSAKNLDPYAGGSNLSVFYSNGLSLEQVLAGFSASEDLAMFYPIVDSSLALTPEAFSFMSEPLFERQWHLRNTGQLTSNPDFNNIGVPGEDARVVGAWTQGFSGQGVVVGVVDTGFQATHPDLAANYRADLSVDLVGGFGGTQALAHGTSVAGIIGAVGDNGIGVTGVAPNVGLADVRLLGSFGVSEAAIVRAITHRNDEIDIYNHSWGDDNDTARLYVPLSPVVLAAFRRSVLFGRPGPDGVPLGVIHVKSSGNDGGHNFDAFAPSGNWDSPNYSGFVSTRYTIAVGGVDHDGSYENLDDGTVTNYMEMGPAVLVVAPTGSYSLEVGLDTGAGSGIWTTDLTGNNGYNQTGNDDGDWEPNIDYTSRFNGTSAAAPIVSGVIALMLEANPRLTYRDVQEILVRSARQNDPTHESWQVNLFQTFEDPESVLVEVPQDEPAEGEEPGPPTFVWLPAEDPFYTPFYPVGSTYGILAGLPPIDDYDAFQAPKYENGAGYTVSYSRGRFSESIGYAHGVVDAELAVKLAKDWHSNDQNLANEISYTTFIRISGARINAAEIVGPDGLGFIIPGGIGGDDNQTFGEYYDEFWEDEPFDLENIEDQNDIPFNDRGTVIVLSPQTLAGFNPPQMKVEWVDVKISIGDASPESINQLRIALRSPDGTVSELNQFMITPQPNLTVNDLDEGLRIGGISSPYDGEGNFVYVTSTNRHWGERLGDELIDERFGGLATNINNAGQWQLIIENYSTDAMRLVSYEIVFHGTEVQGERISGKVGVDAGYGDGSGFDDGNFNFQRGPYESEPWASNIIVRARNVANPEQIVAQFVTGADGNFYFDLAQGDYIIDIVDPMGRAVKNGGANYESSYLVSIDGNSSFGRKAIDGDGYYIDYLNFLLDPGDIPPSVATVSGFVFSDANGNGVFDSSGTAADAPAVNFRVYADLNRSGRWEANEPYAYTDAFGNYQFTIDGVSFLQDFVIAVDPLNGLWTATQPVGGKQTITAAPGSTFSNVNFGFKPPATTQPGQQPGSPNDPGNVQGMVFSDRNGNGVFNQGLDKGVAGMIVYVDTNGDGMFSYHDANGNGRFDIGESVLDQYWAITSSTGGFTLGILPPGTYDIHLDLPEDWKITTPLGHPDIPGDEFHTVTVIGGGQTNSVLFGVQNLALYDFGNLPDSYGTALIDDGPRHFVVPGFRLGNEINGEIDTRDNDINDGVVLPAGAIYAGQVNIIEVTVFGVGGYLNAWMDLNGNGTFDPGEQIIVNADINPGTHQFEVFVPETLPLGDVAARFRWGTAGLNYFGSAIIGEVEDYMFPNAAGSPLAVALPGDYDGDGVVGPNDYLVWKAAYGTLNLAADGNGDGKVDLADYTVWRNNLGNTLPSFASGSGGLAALLAEESDDSQDVAASAAEVSAPLGLAGLQFSSVASPLNSTPSAARAFGFASVASDAELLLLDQVLAGFRDDDEDKGNSSPLVDASHNADDDLVLAAAFDEVGDWRYAL